MRLIFILLILSSFRLFGQNFSLVRYGNLFAIGGAPSSLMISDSTIITTTGYDADWQKIIIRRLSKSGSLEDSSSITFPNVLGSVASRWYSLEQYTQNRFFVVADLIDGNALSRTKILLFDDNLDTLKSRTLALNGYSGTYSWDVLVDGHKLVVLSDIADTTSNQTLKVNLALTFLDTALNFLDTVIIQDYRPQAGGYYPQQIQRFGNHYYISGRCTYFNQFVESFLIKTDRQGNLIWDKRFAYTDANKPMPYNTANGLTVAFGDTIYMLSFFLNRSDGNADYNRIWLMQLDTTGNIIRDSAYADEAVWLTTSDMIITQDGNIAFNGTFKSEYNLGDVGFFWMIDRNFNVLFKRAYHYGNENNRSMLYRLHEWPDSTFLNVGTFMYQWQNPDPSKFNFLWLLSLDKNGCLAPGNCGVLSTPEEEFWLAQTSALQLYPNPAKDVVNLNLLGLNGQATISLYNLQGQKMHSQTLEFTQGEATVTLPVGLPVGTYLVSLKTKTDAYTTKLVVW